jgi:N-methylhydantoinase B
MSRTLAHFLRVRLAPQWRLGDVGITNDPWLASGHLPDITILAPIFRGDRLIAWAGSIAHMADIGGTLWSADTREVFEEGIRIPPTLLYRAGPPTRIAWPCSARTSACRSWSSAM